MNSRPVYIFLGYSIFLVRSFWYDVDMSNEIFSGNLTGFTFFILIILVGIGVAVIPTTPPELPADDPGIPIPVSPSESPPEATPTTPISFWQKDYIYFLGDAIATVNNKTASASASVSPTP